MTVYHGTILSSATGGAYAVSNDLIGQLKNILLNSDLVTVVSDNNPGPTVCRNINLAIGNSQHHLQLNSSSVAGNFNCSIKELSNAGDVHTGRVFNLGSSAAAVLLVAGEHSFVFSVNGSLAPFCVMGSDSRWYVFYPSNVYSDDSDISLSLLSPAYGTFIDSSGKAVASQYAVGSGMNLYAYMKCLWYISTDVVSGTTAFADQNGVNYANFTTKMFISDD